MIDPEVFNFNTVNIWLQPKLEYSQILNTAEICTQPYI